MRRLQFLACNLRTCTADTTQVCALMLGLKIQIFQVAAGTPSSLDTAATRNMIDTAGSFYHLPLLDQLWT